MKDLHGEASRTVGVSPERCLDLLADLEGYPRWYPDVVRRVDVQERNGALATRARVLLHAHIGPMNRDLELTLAVTRRTYGVLLQRVPHERTDSERFEVSWRAVADGQSGTRLQLALDASLPVPRMLPTHGLADGLAAGFVDAAVRELSRSSA
jgi:hypothetical protein